MDSPTHDPVLFTARSYEQDAATWHDQHRDEDRSQPRSDSFDRFATLMVPGGLVLDLGCGSGLDAPALLGRGFRLIGLDISAKMLRIAQSIPEVAGRLLLGEMRALPLADGSVDAVWADGSLHHLPKSVTGRAVREAARVLRRGGILAASVERGDFEGFVENSEGVAGKRWYSYYEPGEFRDLVAAAGIEIIELVAGGPAPHSNGFVGLSGRKR